MLTLTATKFVDEQTVCDAEKAWPDHTFDGYTGRNEQGRLETEGMGWTTAFFTHEQMIERAKAWTVDGWRWVYDPAADTWLDQYQIEGDESQWSDHIIAEGVVGLLDGREITVYPVGGGIYTADEMKRGDVD